MSLAMDTGRIQWVHQALAGDAWTTACLAPESGGRDNCPEMAGPDFDFGSAPALVTLADGRRLVVAGQKSGVLHKVIRAMGVIATAALVRTSASVAKIEHQRRFGPSPCGHAPLAGPGA